MTHSTEGLSQQKLCLYSVPWQVLRVSLLGNWTSVQGADRCLKSLDWYLIHGDIFIKDVKGLPIEDMNNEKTRTWRILNLLNAVRMGYSGQGIFQSEQSKMVERRRNLLSESYELLQRTVDPFEVDDPDKIKLEWLLTPMMIRKEVLKNLTGRLKKHQDSKHRDELRWFLDIVGDK